MNIIIVEDDPLIAADLKRIAQEEGHLAHCLTNSFDRLFQLFQDVQPDLLVLDYKLSDQVTSTELIQRIIAVANPHLVYVTAYYDPDTVDEIIKTNPDGYIVKPFRMDQVIAVLRGVDRKVQKRQQAMKDYRISPRELEVLSLLSKGFSSVDIGKALKVSKYTVDTHRRNMLQKVNLGTTVELVELAKESSLI